MGPFRDLIDVKAIVNGIIAGGIVASAGTLFKLCANVLGLVPGLPWRAIAVAAVTAFWLGFFVMAGRAWRNMEPDHPAAESSGRPESKGDLLWRNFGAPAVMLFVLGASGGVWIACWSWPIGYGAFLAVGTLAGVLYAWTATVGKDAPASFWLAILVALWVPPVAAPILVHLGGWQAGLLAILVPFVPSVVFFTVALILLPILSRLEHRRET